jgi:hypothetical protein
MNFNSSTDEPRSASTPPSPPFEWNERRWPSRNRPPAITQSPCKPIARKNTFAESLLSLPPLSIRVDQRNPIGIPNVRTLQITAGKVAEKPIIPAFLEALADGVVEGFFALCFWNQQVLMPV